jgi:integrative and conjugative element protein (TIGR02256 family)
MQGILMPFSYISRYGIIQFEEKVLEIFSSYQQKNIWDKESGGQLFCRVSASKIIVVEATKPDFKSHRSRFSFGANRDKEQSHINKFFKKGFHYIGDWHTHPENLPLPSSIDLSEIRSIFTQSNHNLSAMLLVIVGREIFPDGIWGGLLDKVSMYPLTLLK